MPHTTWSKTKVADVPPAVTVPRHTHSVSGMYDTVSELPDEQLEPCGWPPADGWPTAHMVAPDTDTAGGGGGGGGAGVTQVLLVVTHAPVVPTAEPCGEGQLYVVVCCWVMLPV